MKPFIIIALMLSFVSPAAPGQTRSDSTTGSTDTTATAELRRGEPGRKFLDENGDGIDDRLQGGGKGMRRGKDRFIDLDGDGICDDRARGLGFKRGGTGSSGPMGTDTRGKGKRQGGKP